MGARESSKSGRPRKVRGVLLVLLWVWAGCVALVCDLFFNVEEFDAIRPDAAVYRGARYVAHRLVGEPYREDDLFGRAAELDAPGRVAAAARGARAEESKPQGVRPRPGTPAGRYLLASLTRVSAAHEDPRRRVAALRGMARMFGPEALPALRRAQDDPDRRVREAAVRYATEIGKNGSGR